ncbi:hypothetical protein F1728_04260 [Gimesia benthica]|uniref:Uncharacterized protein n=1 Tax=Gimesia benthica TaxID=2608982 RepID=A0A6I6A7R6_9PLAN|nr:hypothetical protein [Gimesia benthica]QGQ21950.1 hypothetical protein F1728_04260 [Gimesia benthica]
MSAPEKYILLDANLLAGYYAPQTFNKYSKPAEDKITNLIDAVRTGCAPHARLLTPEICVSEAQTVLSKHANSKWKGTMPKSGDTEAIHGKSYKTIVKKMREDLHGGNVIESIPLARYHVLAKHLITPIDHNLHLKQRVGNKPVKEMGGTDQLICGMAIWLTRFLGHERLHVFTADYRMYKVLEKARKITPRQMETWGIIEMAEKNIGFSWSADYFPQYVYLPQASDKQLRDIFGSWPLPTTKKKTLKHPKAVKEADVETLLALYKAIGVGRDRLPYSPKIEILTRQFNDSTGHSLSEAEIWSYLISRLKKGGGKLNR